MAPKAKQAARRAGAKEKKQASPETAEKEGRWHVDVAAVDQQWFETQPLEVQRRVARVSPKWVERSMQLCSSLDR